MVSYWFDSFFLFLSLSFSRILYRYSYAHTVSEQCAVSYRKRIRLFVTRLLNVLDLSKFFKEKWTNDDNNNNNNNSSLLIFSTLSLCIRTTRATRRATDY